MDGSAAIFVWCVIVASGIAIIFTSIKIDTRKRRWQRGQRIRLSIGVGEDPLELLLGRAAAVVLTALA